jgi:hypothetical protein
MKKLYKGLIRLFMLMVWLMLLFESVMYESWSNEY